MTKLYNALSKVVYYFIVAGLLCFSVISFNIAYTQWAPFSWFVQIAPLYVVTDDKITNLVFHRETARFFSVQRVYEIQEKDNPANQLCSNSRTFIIEPDANKAVFHIPLESIFGKECVIKLRESAKEYLIRANFSIQVDWGISKDHTIVTPPFKVSDRSIGE